MHRNNLKVLKVMQVEVSGGVGGGGWVESIVVFELVVERK